ncbi:hypothetical protein MPER_08212, partial [Moniliophthora perniciosa FA553]
MSADNSQPTTTARYALRMQAIPEASRIFNQKKIDYNDKATHMGVTDISYFDDPNWDEDADDIEDDSPYPEVQKAVANTDDPLMPGGSST